MFPSPFLENVFVLLRVFGILGWFPARIDPKSGLVTLKISPPEIVYCILVNLALISANIPTFLTGLEVLTLN